jgi:2-C-methyl-D-erythritol 4-phosphate cytidylyltransferase/2-C-methyl-D-erythritol 2,4-cyclodiphosphate synthase
MARCVALVVAAGRGSRFGGEIPKQWRDLGGRPVLRHSLAAFAAHPGIDAVRAVIHPDDRAFYDRAASGLNLGEPIAGGPTRQDSVRLGLEALATQGYDHVLVHDGARPFIDAGVISRVIAALGKNPGAIPALPVHDTLKRSDGTVISETVSRAGLWRAQTPQGFHFGPLLAAHRAVIGHELTDDAAVAEHAGLAVVLVPGSEDNVKITTTEDLRRGEAKLSGPGDIRVATGFDVHKFAAGDHVTLCNVAIPHDAALDGHSDADVALHALTDALLGCISAGDIGRHFPPTDPRWKGADSAIFLAHAGALVEGLGAEIVHLDLTVICERPKVGPHRAAMSARVAEILGIAEHRVSIKATTTEGLGFTGRREGIAAQAVATIRRPR